MNKVICVTGPMAAGKNYICSQMELEGWTSIDADLLVHDAIKNKTEEIYSTFKPYADKKSLQLKTEDGQINRRALGQIVFSDPSLLKKQEDIVYPEITRMINDFIRENSYKKIIINATVLYKTPELLNKCEYVVYITAPLLTRLKRARKRDNLPYKQILRRFWAQRNLLKCYKKNIESVIVIKNS